jgi:hypothetical protein
MDPDSLTGLPDEPPVWTPDARHAVDRALENGVPSDAAAFYARWWQLESWLRLLLYLEMRAKWGRSWAQKLPNRTQHKAQRDDENRYIPSPDADSPIAYLDFGDVLALLENDEIWPLVEKSLPPRKRWSGLADELRALRNRNAHLRRPHRDDLRRVEQSLRDLERGARIAMESFNRQHRFTSDDNDPVAIAWAGKQHPDAKRLVDHAARSYRVDFSLHFSRRPWATGDERLGISGSAGYLVHGRWLLRDGAFLSPADLWSDQALDLADARRLLVSLRMITTHWFQSPLPRLTEDVRSRTLSVPHLMPCSQRGHGSRLLVVDAAGRLMRSALILGSRLGRR